MFSERYGKWHGRSQGGTKNGMGKIGVERRTDAKGQNGTENGTIGRNRQSGPLLRLTVVEYTSTGEVSERRVRSADGTCDWCYSLLDLVRPLFSHSGVNIPIMAV